MDIIERINGLSDEHWVQSQHKWGVGPITELGTANDLRALASELTILRQMVNEATAMRFGHVTFTADFVKQYKEMKGK